MFMLKFQKDFSILFNIFLVHILICPRCSNKQGNVSFDLMKLVVLQKSSINV